MRASRVFRPGLRFRSGAGAASACLLAAGLLLGCASKQTIPLDCVPREVSVYVDGKLLEGHPDSIALSTKQTHKLYFKRPGHAPELLVLESLEGPDGTELSVEDTCVDLVPIGVGRELTIEIEE